MKKRSIALCLIAAACIGLVPSSSWASHTSCPGIFERFPFPVCEVLESLPPVSLPSELVLTIPHQDIHDPTNHVCVVGWNDWKVGVAHISALPPGTNGIYWQPTITCLLKFS